MFLSSTSLPHFDISRPGKHKHFEISYDNHYKQIIKLPITVVQKRKAIKTEYRTCNIMISYNCHCLPCTK